MSGVPSSSGQTNSSNLWGGVSGGGYSNGYDSDIDMSNYGDDDDLGTYNYMTNERDCVICLIDCSRDMFVPTPKGDIPFQMAMKSCVSILTEKIIASDTDLMGVCFYGTKEKQNDNNFDGVYIYLPLDVPDIDRIKLAEAMAKVEEHNFEPGFYEGDFPLNDALWTCSAMFSACQQKVQTKRIFLFTNNDNPNANSADHVRRATMQRARDFADLEVIFSLFPMNRGQKPFSYSHFYYDLLLLVNGQVDDIDVPVADRFDELNQRVKMKEHHMRSLGTLGLSLGASTELSVKLCSFMQEAGKLRHVWLDSRNNELLKTTTKNVCLDTGSLLMPTQVKLSHEYGGQRVVFSNEELGAIKNQGLKAGLTLLGFKKREALKEWHNIKHPYFLYPDEKEVAGSTKLFAALLDSMRRKDRIAICRLAARANAQPRFVALLPSVRQISEEGSCVRSSGFSVVTLPYADDIRDLEVAPPVTEDGDPSAIKKAKKFINELTMDGFTPRDFVNPKLQKHFNSVHALALEKPQVEEVVDEVTPHTEAFNAPPAREALSAFRDTFFPEDYSYVQRSKPPVKKAAKKRKASDIGGGGSAAPAAKKAKRSKKPLAAHSAPLLRAIVENEEVLKKYLVKELQEVVDFEGVPLTVAKPKKKELMDALRTYFEENADAGERCYKQYVLFYGDDDDAEAGSDAAVPKVKFSDATDAAVAPKSEKERVLAKVKKEKKASEEEKEKKKEKEKEKEKEKVKVNEEEEEEVVEEEEDNRPMCKYGAKCYRENPMHLKQYRHPPKK